MSNQNPYTPPAAELATSHAMDSKAIDNKLKRLIGFFGVGFCGYVTATVVAISNVLVEKYFQVNIFSLSVWGILPMGAIMVGVAAASGYYLGAVWLHRPPTKILLFQMIAVAGITQLTIYYFDYLLVLQNNSQITTDLFPFTAYLKLRFTHMSIEFFRPHMNTGEVGAFGYVVAVIQFAGFLLGGFGVYNKLRSKLICNDCTQYFRVLSNKLQRFADYESAATHYHALTNANFSSPEYVQILHSSTGAGPRGLGKYSTSSILFGCPNCGQQAVEDKLLVVTEKKSYRDEQGERRCLLVPKELNLLATFRREPAAT